MAAAALILAEQCFWKTDLVITVLCVQQQQRPDLSRLMALQAAGGAGGLPGLPPGFPSPASLPPGLAGLPTSTASLLAGVTQSSMAHMMGAGRLPGPLHPHPDLSGYPAPADKERELAKLGGLPALLASQAEAERNVS